MFRFRLHRIATSLRRLRGPSTISVTEHDIEPSKGALEYARGIHAEVLEWNKNLYTRAQIALTLDGIVLGATGAALAGKPGDLRKTVAVFGITTWIALCLAGAALVASVLASALALYSRHGQGRDGIQIGDYEPANMWFYARVAKLDFARFVEVGEQADTMFEIRARLAQVRIMAPIMVGRARWVNRAFACTQQHSFAPQSPPPITSPDSPASL